MENKTEIINNDSQPIIKVIEEDLENVEKKCEKVNCMALYDAVMATFKLIYDLFFCCCKKKD